MSSDINEPSPAISVIEIIDSDDDEPIIEYPNSFKRPSLRRNIIAHKCDYCEASFITSISARTHMYICDKKLSSSVGDVYMQVYLKPEDRPTATITSVYNMFSMVDLNSGDIVKRKPTDIKEYQCEVCMKHFANAKGLGAHKRVHKNKKNKTKNVPNIKSELHPCSTCNKNCLSELELQNHVLTHPTVALDNESPTTPDKENIRLNYSKSKSKVINNDDTVKELNVAVNIPRDYQCHQCGMTFTRVMTLVSHEGMHKCDSCTIGGLQTTSAINVVPSIQSTEISPGVLDVLAIQETNKLYSQKRKKFRPKYLSDYLTDSNEGEFCDYN